MFAEVLRDHGVTVHHFADLLAETLDDPPRRAPSSWTGSCTAEPVGPALVATAARAARRRRPGDAGRAADRRRHSSPTCRRCSVGSLRWQTLDARRLRPRRRCRTPCSSATTRPGSTAGSAINPMAKAGPAARVGAQPRGLPLPPAVRRPRRSRSTTATTTSTTSRPPSRAATSTSSAAARCWSAWVSGPPRWASRSWPASCSAPAAPTGSSPSQLPEVARPYAPRHRADDGRLDDLRALPLPRPGDAARLGDHARRPGGDRRGTTGGLHVERRDDLFATIAEALGRRQASPCCRADEDARAAEREQWDDANNFLTLAPGVVVGYERNTVTNTHAARPRHRGAGHPGQRARPRPRRRPVHDLPDPARRHLPMSHDDVTARTAHPGSPAQGDRPRPRAVPRAWSTWRMELKARQARRHRDGRG